MNDLLPLLNNLVDAAIYHGGDPGGPYFCNGAELLDAARTLASIIQVRVVCCDYHGNEIPDPDNERDITHIKFVR